MKLNGIFIAVALVLVSAGLSAGANGRDFAGNFSLTGVNENADGVALTITLHLFNYSGEDLKQASLTVRGPRLGPVLASFAPIADWPRTRDIVIRESFTVTRETYRIWSSRTQPNVFVTYSSGGQAREGSVELSRRPTIADIPSRR